MLLSVSYSWSLTLSFRQHNKSSNRVLLQPRTPCYVPTSQTGIPLSESNPFVPLPLTTTLNADDDHGGEVVNEV